MRREQLPGVGHALACVVEKPLQITGARQENAAYHRAQTGLRVRGCICQPQPAAPGATDHQPAVYAQMLAQALHVLN